MKGTPSSCLGFDRRFLPVALFMVAAVAAIYGRTFRHEFINFDDRMYILDNPQVSGGLSWQGFLWAFGRHAANWHPLTWLSHMLDAQFFGLWAGGHHLTSAGFHAANAVLLAALLTAMTGAFWRSAAVAALFAVHPLRVESVAWAAERKDVLSALLWLLTAGAYLRYARRPGPGRYFSALGLFALGLAAKPMLVTLPFVLLLLDWWPLGRSLPPGDRNSPRPSTQGSRAWLALLVEKVPFLALSLLSSLVTLWAQRPDVAPDVTAAHTTRIANAAVSCLRYLGAFIWPENLAIFYPYSRAGITQGAAAAVALVVISAAAIALGRRRPYLPVGWLWYLGTLVPVLGFVQVGGQARSDRYTYLAMIGVTVGLIWLTGDLWPRRAGARRALAAAFAIALAALAVSAAAYVRVWRDSLTLFDYTARVTKDNYLALNNLGTALLRAGRAVEAVKALREAEAINPDYCDAHYNLGNALIISAQFPEALEPLTRALQCYEREGRGSNYVADTHYCLGVANQRLKQYPRAQWHFQTVLRLVPDHPGGRVALNALLAKQGKGTPGTSFMHPSSPR